MTCWFIGEWWGVGLLSRLGQTQSTWQPLTHIDSHYLQSLLFIIYLAGKKKKAVGKYLGLLGYFHFLPSYHSFPFWTFSYRSGEIGAQKYRKQSLACLTHHPARLSLGFPSLVLCAGRSPHLDNSFGLWSWSPLVMQTLLLAPQSPPSVPLSALDTISVSVQGSSMAEGPSWTSYQLDHFCGVVHRWRGWRWDTEVGRHICREVCWWSGRSFKLFLLQATIF